MSEPSTAPHRRAAEKRPRATYEDLCAVPEHLVAEIIDGELITRPRPASSHAFATTAATIDIGGGVGMGRGGSGTGGWLVLMEPELHIVGEVLVPDLAGWRPENLPSPLHAGHCTLAPDWICEVLSPCTAGVDRVRKNRLYARAGVLHYWLVDPAARTLEVYRLEEGRWVQVGTHGEDETVRTEPFDTVELALARWWLPGPEPATGDASKTST